MVKSHSSSPPFCIHLVFFPRGNYFNHFFFAYCSRHILCTYKQVCVAGWGWRRHIIETALHLAFVALQHILEILLYLFPQSCWFLLKGWLIAACKSSTGDSNAQPGLGATDSVKRV